MSDRNGFSNPYASVFTSGDESWVYPTYSDGKPIIRVQWLTFQGPEYEIAFEGKAERDQAARKLFDALAPASERAIRGRDKWDLAEEAGHERMSRQFFAEMSLIEDRQRLVRKGEFTVKDMTITPDMIVEVLGPDTRFRITPESLKSREAFELLGISAGYRQGLAMTGAEVLDALENARTAAPRM